MKQVPIPSLLSGRSLFRGLPIPFTALVSAEGVPDFRVTDLGNWQRAVKYKLCGLCGIKLGFIVYFIGGPLCDQNRMFFDPPMHEECARYAFEVCPFLAFSAAAYRTRAGDSELHISRAAAGGQRPERMGLFKTKSYTTVERQGEVLIQAGPWLDTEWFEGEEK